MTLLSAVPSGASPSRVRLVVGLLGAGLLAALTLGGCGFYSFSGATIPSHINTIAIPLAQNNSISPINTLDRDLTDLLTDNFVGRTKLSLTTNETNADATLTATIQGYQNEPTGVSGDERATVNRVTIRVAVRYYDQAKEEERVNQTFSGYGEYDPTASSLAGERQAAQVALERIADNVFTTATSNW